MGPLYANGEWQVTLYLIGLPLSGAGQIPDFPNLPVVVVLFI